MKTSLKKLTALLTLLLALSLAACGGADDDGATEREQERLATVSLPPDARAIGQKLGDLALHAVGVRVVGLRRANGRMVEAADDWVLADGDTLVLSGQPAALALAEDKLLQG